MAQRRPHGFNPVYLQMVHLQFLRTPITEIAKQTGYNRNTVKRILSTDWARGIFEAFERRSFECLAEVQTALQAYAPRAVDNLRQIAETASSERERRYASQYLLDAAGHKAKTTVQVERTSAVDTKYRGKSEREIRDIARAELDALKQGPSTVH